MNKIITAVAAVLLLGSSLWAQSEFDPQTLLKPKVAGSFTLPVNIEARTSYETLGERAGINVVFLPAFKGETPVPLRVEGRTFFETMDRLSSQTGNMWVAWDSKTVVVAPDTQQHHRDADPQVYKAFYLDNVDRDALREIGDALKTTLQARTSYVAPETRTIIVHGPAAQVQAAERLISEKSGKGMPLPASAPVAFPAGNIASVSMAENGAVKRVLPSNTSHMEKMLGSSISIDMNQPPPAIYEELASRAGMNFVFDRQMKEQPAARFRVEGLDLVSTLNLLALQTGTHWQPLSDSTIYVMDDNMQNRRDREQMLVKVIYLPGTLSRAAFLETLNVLRTSLNLRGVFQEDSHKALIIKDTPLRVFLVERAIESLVRNSGKPKSVTLTPEPGSLLAENGWIPGNAAQARPKLEVKLRSKTSVRLNETPKGAFQAVAGLAGLDVTFDSRFVDGAETAVSLSNVDIMDALDLLAWRTRNSWQAVDAHTIRVFPDTQAARRDLESVQKTIQPADVTTANGLLNVLRTVFALRQVFLDEKNAIIIRDTADNVAIAEKLVELLGAAATTP